MGGAPPPRREDQAGYGKSSSQHSSHWTPNLDPQSREESLDSWLSREFSVAAEAHSQRNYIEQQSTMSARSHPGDETMFSDDPELHRLLSEMAPATQAGETPISAPPGAAQPYFDDMMQGLSVPQDFRRSISAGHGGFESQPSLERNLSAATSASSHGSEEKGSEKEQEEELLLKLKDEQNLPWKRISQAFKQEFNKDYSIPALQMRYRRLRQRRLLDFSEIDQAALLAAYEYWETKRWDIISDKMQEYGATDAWTPKACAEAWRRLQESRGRSESQRSVGRSDEPTQMESETFDFPDVSVSRDPSASNR